MQRDGENLGLSVVGFSGPIFMHLSIWSSSIPEWLLLHFLNMQQDSILNTTGIVKGSWCSWIWITITNFLLNDNVCSWTWKSTVAGAVVTATVSCFLSQRVYGCNLKLMDSLAVPSGESISLNEIGIKI